MTTANAQGESRLRRKSRLAEDSLDVLRWWGKTLLGLVPDGLVNAYSTRRQSVFLLQREDGFHAALPGKGELGSLSDNRKLRRRVAASDPVLLLEPHDVLKRRRRMPVGSLNRLAHAMQLQIPAETPFSLDEIYSGIRIVHGPDADGQVVVEQAIVRRDLAEARLADLHALEIDLAGADAMDDDGEPCGFNLLPTEKCARQGAFLPAANRVLSFAALALTVALATSWYLDLSRQARTLETAANNTGEVAREVLTLQAQAQQDAATIEQINSTTANPGRFTAAYAAVTDALGDKTWLEGFTYSGNTASLAGLTREPDTLISALESSPQVLKARFTSSVITDRRHEAERFRLEVTFRTDKQGEAIAAMEDQG
ncbi:PilN domain-containing protein [Henriciella sp.]|uniref:PilN domain-containing protein n=1 Tax=Henriciella sp. TaxID=1968823 RepID=UPI00260FB80C|nr:PilN domain-containing protein [Henriciella sp.]